MNDQIDKEIYFDSNNICNHCLRYDSLFHQESLMEKKQKKTKQIIIKNQNKGNGKNMIV